jgi:hypothetical protein
LQPTAISTEYNLTEVLSWPLSEILEKVAESVGQSGKRLFWSG